MLEKIIQNKKVITIILSIVGIALVGPDIIELLPKDINSNVYYFILYSTLVCSLVYVLIFALTDRELDNFSLICPVCFLYGGPLVCALYNILEANSTTYIYHLALYTFAISIYIIYVLNSKRVKLKVASYVAISIVLAINLVAVFSGSTNSLARLIMGSIILFNIYLNSSKEKEEVVKNENN